MLSPFLSSRSSLSLACACVVEIRTRPRRRRLWQRSRPGWLAVDLRGRGQSGGADDRSDDGGQRRHILEEKGTADAASTPVEEKRSEVAKSTMRRWCRARARYPLPRRPWPVPSARSMSGAVREAMTHLLAKSTNSSSSPAVEGWGQAWVWQRRGRWACAKKKTGGGGGACEGGDKDELLGR